MLFVIESDIEGVCQPGDIIMLNQLQNMVDECEFVMVTAFSTIKEASDYSLFIKGQ